MARMEPMNYCTQRGRKVQKLTILILYLSPESKAHKTPKYARTEDSYQSVLNYMHSNYRKAHKILHTWVFIWLLVY